MKKALTKALLIAMTIVTLATIIPLSANASTSNKQQIYSFLTNEMKLNSAAACGILANIERESNFKSTSVIRDSNGRKSGGLCQWNGGRFNNLKKYCEKNGFNYLSIEGQLNYLKYELSQNSYSYIYDYLKNVANNADGAYKAGYYWCYHFEVPSNKRTKAKQRGSMAEDDYWPDYGNKTPSKPKLSFTKDSKSYDMDNVIGFKWTSGGKNCTSYKLFVAEKTGKDKKYNWSDCKVYNISSGKTSYTISKNGLPTGSYAAKIRAINNTTGEYKDSNLLYFTVSCKTHSFSTKVTVQPTLEKTGKKVDTCKQCGYQKSGSVNKLTLNDFKKMKMCKPSVSSTAKKAIKLRWNKFAGATGYYVYQRVNNNWKLIGKVSAKKEPAFLVQKLTPATEYKFAIRAYIVKDKKTYFSVVSPSVTTSTETAVPFIDSVERGSGKGTVIWNKVAGADGYQIYISTGENSKSFKKLASVDSKTTKYTATGLKKGQYYNFKIRTYIKCSDGSYVYSKFSDVKYILAK